MIEYLKSIFKGKKPENVKESDVKSKTEIELAKFWKTIDGEKIKSKMERFAFYKASGLKSYCVFEFLCCDEFLKTSNISNECREALKEEIIRMML